MSNTSSFETGKLNGKIEELAEQIGIQYISSATSLIQLASSVSDCHVKEFYAETSSDITDFPSYLSGNGAIYRVFITIKRVNARLMSTVTAVTAGGVPIMVNGFAYVGDNAFIWSAVMGKP